MMVDLDFSDLFVSELEYVAPDNGFGIVWRYDDPVDVESELYARSFSVVRKTPKGCWIKAFGAEKFILQGSGKRWAYPLKSDALASYIIRKQRQIQHSANTYDRANTFLMKAQTIKAVE